MKIVYIVNVDWFFLSHRLPIALRCIEDGHEVHLICNFTTKLDEIKSYGIHTHNLPLSRSGTSVLSEIGIVYQLNKLVSSIQPDVIHGVTIKGVVYGGLVSRFNKISGRVFSISGLGYIFIDNSIKIRILKSLVCILFKLALGGRDRVKVIFQNSSDRDLFLQKKIINSSQAILIRGSGVDLDKFVFEKEQVDTKVVMLVARLLKDKGVIEFCKVSEKFIHNPNVKFVIVGDIDEGNPNAVTRQELSYYVNNKAVEHWHYRNDIHLVIPKSNLMVLPSYREGLPKSLLEAAACGRAVVTTDVPGCRDAIEPNTGLLVPPKDVLSLFNAIEELIFDDFRRQKMGGAGRLLAESEFSIHDVVKKHLSIYLNFF